MTDSTIDPRITDLRGRKDAAKVGGGLERIEAQHAKGKATARERLDLMLDKGSFREVDALVTHDSHDFGLDKQRIPGDGVVTGFGTIDDRLVYVFFAGFHRFRRQCQPSSRGENL